jgi:O-antigen ligase
VMLMWAVHLMFPVHYLQHARWTIFGQVVPIYYFFTVFPLVGAGVLALALKRHWTKWEVLWWLLPLICVPGILASGDKLWSCRQWLSWVVRGIVPGGILFSYCRKEENVFLTRKLYPLIIGASILGLTELYLYYRTPTNVWDNFLLKVDLGVAQPKENLLYRPSQRAYPLPTSRAPGGTQGNRVPYAATLVAFLPIGLWLWRYRKGASWLHLLALATLLSVLVLAQVRAVWVGGLLILLALRIVGFYDDRRQIAKVAIASLMCLGAFFAWPVTRGILWARFNSFHLTETSIRERLAVLKTAKVLEDKWAWGVGYGQFPVAGKPFYPENLPWNETPDDQYLRWAIENGIPSFLCLLAFFAGLLCAGWRAIKNMGGSRIGDFYRALLLGWLGIAATFSFFDGFYWGACNMTFWCFLGLFASSIRGGVVAEGA